MDAPEALVAERYRLRNRVGAGGMGVVWEAWDERLQRSVALKLLHRQPGVDPAQAELANLRAMREARITARLHHRYAVPIFDVVEYEGQACLVMPYLPSITLGAVLRDGGPLSPPEAAQVGAQVASALAAAHGLGIVHRDVKPGNVLITEDGTALISDFGIAHALGDATLTTTGLVHGTPAYLAPEVARGGESTYASDVFSLGATLYEALEGSPPFGTAHNSIALLHRVAAGQISPPQRSGPLTQLVLHTLAAAPEERPTMAAVAHALTERRPEPIAVRPPSVGPLPVLGAEATSTVKRAPTAAAVGPPGMAASVAAGPDAGQRTDGVPAPVPSPVPSPVPARAAAPTWTQPGGGRPGGRRRRGALLLVAAVAIAAATLGAVLWQHRSSNSGTAGPGSVSAPASAPPSSPAKASAQPSASRTQTPSATPTRSSSAPSTRRDRSSPAPSTLGGAPTSAQLVSAISSYYALMPSGTDRAWPRMTAAYQEGHAGGRHAYQKFWHAIRGVSASGVTAQPPDTAEATITYDYKDGRVVQERTRYRLVDDGGVLKIADSVVLSSSTS